MLPGPRSTFAAGVEPSQRQALQVLPSVQPQRRAGARLRRVQQPLRPRKPGHGAVPALQGGAEGGGHVGRVKVVQRGRAHAQPEHKAGEGLVTHTWDGTSGALLDCKASSLCKLWAAIVQARPGERSATRLAAMLRLPGPPLPPVRGGGQVLLR